MVDEEAHRRVGPDVVQAAEPRFLGRLPRTPCVVKRIEEFEEKDAPIAYYRPAAIDGSRPAAYFVNTYKPEIVLLGATVLGRDLAGAVATTLLTGLTADCTELMLVGAPL